MQKSGSLESASEVEYEKGIVFQDFIIAARDGEVFSLNETIANAARIYGIKADYAVIEGMGWTPIEIE